jgi:hypothetical protein
MRRVIHLLEAIGAVLRDVPREIRVELERASWMRAADRRWASLLEVATWRCTLHDGDVIAVETGGGVYLLRRAGAMIVPVDHSDAWLGHEFPLHRPES